MPGDEHIVVIQKLNLITVVLGLNLQYSCRQQVVKEYASFDFRLHKVAIHFVAEVGMTAK